MPTLHRQSRRDTAGIPSRAGQPGSYRAGLQRTYEKGLGRERGSQPTRRIVLQWIYGNLCAYTVKLLSVSSGCLTGCSPENRAYVRKIPVFRYQSAIRRVGCRDNMGSVKATLQTGHDPTNTRWNVPSISILSSTTTRVWGSCCLSTH